MDITAMTIGAPHRWRVYTDMGQGEPNTLVYPVQVKWNMKTFYRTRTIVTTDREGPSPASPTPRTSGSAAAPPEHARTERPRKFW